MAASVTCPRCGQMQSAGPSCTACGAALAEPASPLNPPQPQVTAAEAPVSPPGQPPQTAEKPRPRLSRMAVLAVLSGFVAAVAVIISYFTGLAEGGPCKPPRLALSLGYCRTEGPLVLVWTGVELLASPLRLMVPAIVAGVLGALASSRIKRSQGSLTGRGVARLGMWLGIMTFLLGYLLSSSQSACPPRWQYGRAASDARGAVTQAVVYANEEGVYPTSITVLKNSGYLNMLDKDPWGNLWVLSPVLLAGSQPKAGDDVYVYSRGICGTGTYTPRAWKWERGSADTGKYGAVGYSSLYGSFRGH